MVSLNNFSTTINPNECSTGGGRLCALPIQQVISGKSGVVSLPRYSFRVA